MTYSDISLWHETAGDPWEPRPALMGDLEVDVAIVGAGYTGLWTAYYLAEARPDLKIAILEAEVARVRAEFPTDDVAADTRRMNAFIEERVREMPEQYYWVHKRFKTRPPGEAKFY